MNLIENVQERQLRREKENLNNQRVFLLLQIVHATLGFGLRLAAAALFFFFFLLASILLVRLPSCSLNSPASIAFIALLLCALNPHMERKTKSQPPL